MLCCDYLVIVGCGCVWCVECAVMLLFADCVVACCIVSLWCYGSGFVFVGICSGCVCCMCVVDACYVYVR